LRNPTIADILQSVATPLPDERILIPGDPVEFLKEMCDVLIDAGYPTQAATTGAEALELVRNPTRAG
jgi:CheY-like chemotaxis protein